MWKALVVEDCRETRRLIARALAGVCEVIEAGSVADARVQLGRQLPDLIVLDVALPDGDGYQLCSQLQSDERTATIPLLFLTARAATKDKVAAFSLGADDYVAKPFEPFELRVRVTARLAKEQARAPKGRIRLCLVRGVRLDGHAGQVDELRRIAHGMRGPPALGRDTRPARAAWQHRGGRRRRVARDITARRAEEKRAAVQRGIVRAVAEAASLEGTYRGVLATLCRELGWDYGEIWWVDETYDVLRAVGRPTRKRRPKTSPGGASSRHPGRSIRRSPCRCAGPVACWACSCCYRTAIE